MDKEQKAFEEYAPNEGINIGKVQGQYFYNETKMALKDFSAGYQARAALDMSEELAARAKDFLDAFNTNTMAAIGNNSTITLDLSSAQRETFPTMLTALEKLDEALNKYRERKI